MVRILAITTFFSVLLYIFKSKKKKMFKWFFPETATLNDQQRQIFALAKGRGPGERFYKAEAV